MIKYALLAFAGIAVFVGAFVISNTLGITIAQRTRELATLRTLGASRRQVLRSIILEALVMGIFAAIVGLVLYLTLVVINVKPLILGACSHITNGLEAGKGVILARGRLRRGQHELGEAERAGGRDGERVEDRWTERPR